MKALSLWRPWPWAIFHAPNSPKRVENRTWKPWDSIIGQRIALHAGKRFDRSAIDFIDDIVAGGGFVPEVVDADLCPKKPADHPTGIIGTARVLGWVDEPARTWSPGLDFTQALEALDSDWIGGPIGWVLGEVQALAQPIPIGGKQGLWTLPSGVAKQIIAGGPSPIVAREPVNRAKDVEPRPADDVPRVLPGQLVLL